MDAVIQSNLDTISHWDHDDFSEDSVYFYNSSFDMASIPSDGFLPVATNPIGQGLKDFIPHAPSSMNAAAGLQGFCEELESIPLDPNISDNAFDKPPSMYQYQSNTPTRRRLTTYRHYFSVKQNIPSKAMATYLAIELNHLKPTPIVTLPNNIFPDSLLPFDVNVTLLDKLKGVWDAQRKHLRPPADYTESAVLKWLEDFGKLMSKATGCKPVRRWSNQYMNTPVPNTNLVRKPDIVLLNSSAGVQSEGWKHINAVVEVTCRDMNKDLKAQINNKTYLMLSEQHNRRFVPFVAICGPTMYLIVTDREGQAMAEINYLQGGEYHALCLLRVIAALVFSNNETIGFDPSILNLQGPEGGIGISAGGKVYAVKSIIHAVRGVVGRSSRVWSAYDHKDPDRKLCIIKDGWIQEGRADVEKVHLEKLKDVTGVPKLIWGGAVEITDPSSNSRSERKFRQDDTLWMRLGFSEGRQYRIHRRLVLSPVGELLSSFTSLGELIAAFRDVVVGMFRS